MEIRRSYDRLISTMGFPILVRCHLYTESGPWTLSDKSNVIIVFSIYFQSGSYWWCCLHLISVLFNPLRPRQNRRHFADDVFEWNFLNENVWIPIKISLKFVSKCPINNIPALVQIMAWRRTGDKPLSEPMMTQFNDVYIRHSASLS